MRDLKQGGNLRKIWLIIWPMILYTLISVAAEIGLLAFQSMTSADPAAFFETFTDPARALEWTDANYGTFSLITMLIAIPVFLLMLRRNARTPEIREADAEKPAFPAAVWFLLVLLGISICIVLNHLLMYSGLTELLYDSFSDAAELLYGRKLVLEILSLVLLAPLVEELLFRGVIYERMRLFFPRPIHAIIISALVFGLYHGNLLQGIYAFLIGLLAAFLRERFHRLTASILLHAGANLASVLITDTGIMDFCYESDGWFIAVTLFCMAVFVVCFYGIICFVNPSSEGRQQ